MPGYISNLLTHLKHPTPARSVDAQYKWNPPDSSPFLSVIDTGLQSTVGSLLIYTRAVDPSMLPSLNEFGNCLTTWPPTRMRSSAIMKITPNGPILTECCSLKHVIASATKAKTSALFHNAQNDIPLRHLLTAMGHPQLPMPLKTDNQVANAFVHYGMRLKKLKAWDMCLWWLKDKVVQKNFQIFWEKGATNLAD